MSILDAVILGAAQGLTEFLPVSSSGHILLVSNLLGISDPGMTFNILVHFATLLAVIIFFWKDILLILKSTILSIVLYVKDRDTSLDDNARFGWFIILATIPTGLIGIFFKDFFESFFSAGWHVGFFLLITGALLVIANKYNKGTKSIKEFTWLDSVFVGVAQGLAIFPGISRSGATISMSLLRDLDTTTAAKFSFILSIPAILGAMILDIGDISALAFSAPYISGVISSFCFGLLAIKVFIEMLKRKKLLIFSYYCFFIGLIIIISEFI